MKNIAFIPVRGGSKSIPLKNIKLLCGKPLVYWTIKAACECEEIDTVYVSTDSIFIKETVEQFGLNKVIVVNRSQESATDTATTEFAMLEFSSEHMFDNIVLIQATSPLLTVEDLNKGFELYNEENTDSVLSVVKQKRFNWHIADDGNAIADNYDIYKRPRRQDFDGYYVENGAFYITSREALLKTGNRISGNVKVVEMSEDTFFEVDEPDDWKIIEILMNRRKNKDIKERASNIKMFLTDCDGCLTDTGMYYTEYGDEIKRFSTLDGKAFEMLRERGIITGIITGEKVELVKRRAEKMKIDIVELGIDNKLQVIKKYCKMYDVELSQVLYVGDDLADIEAIKAVGIGCAVKNAVSAVKEVADYITQTPGGSGAIREIADFFLHC